MVLAGLALLGACGGNDNGGAIAAGPTSSAKPVQAALVIDTAGTSPARHGSITCSDDAATGTGHLIDPNAAVAACVLVLRDVTAQERLTAGPPTGQVCAQVFGGAEQAKISGTLLGKPVDTTVKRTDGCGIADWDHLAPLVGSAG
jgi:hypothetical protein